MKKEEKTCGSMILTPNPLHNGGMWCSEKKPCALHDLNTETERIEYAKSFLNGDVERPYKLEDFIVNIDP